MLKIFNIGIDIDVDQIKEAIANKAEKDAIDFIHDEVSKIIFDRRGYYSSENPMRQLVCDEIDKYLERYKDDIINIAADRLAERLIRTKAGKEILQKYEGD